MDLFKKLTTYAAAAVFSVTCAAGMVGCEDDDELEDAAEEVEDTAEDATE